MQKLDIAKRITKQVGLPLSQSKEIVQMVFDSIGDALAEEGRLELRNFGVFDVRRYEPRLARNPRTGEAVHVPARKRIAFKPGKALKQKVIDT